MAEHIRIYEVGPRDGLQNEPNVISVADKLRLIRMLETAGLRDIEVGSFVSPKWVPQMADADQILGGLDYSGDTNFAVLVPNMRGWDGFQRARAGLPRVPGEIAVFISASQGFSRANLNCSVEESLERLAPVVAAARDAGVKVRGYVSCITDCPFDGEVEPEDVLRAVVGLRALADMEISLADTIGRGTPERVARAFERVMTEVDVSQLAGHFHDTSGQACDNIEAVIGLGVRCFDAAAGGLGGCPYAPGAPGNVATEAVVDRVEALGFETGVNREALAEASRFARSLRG